MTDVAALGYRIDASQAAEAARELDRMSGAAKRADASAENLERSARSTGKAMLTAGGQANAMRTQIGGAGLQTANLAAQFNDIGVMLAAGQSPLMLALQQGTQVNQAFDMMGRSGASAGARVAALRTAFASVISPANLLTIGIIAGGAALVQWGINAIKAGEDTKSFKNVIDELAESTEDLRTEIFMAQRGLDNIAQAGFLREIDRLQAKIAENQSKLADASNRQARNIRATITLDTERLETLRNQLEENQKLTDEAERTSNALKLIQGANLGSFENQVRALATELGIAADEARRLLQNLPVGMDYGNPNALMGFTGSELIPPKRKPTAGVGQGGGAEQDPFKDNLELLIEGLRTEREILDANYEENLLILNDRRAMEILGEEEHRQALLRVEEQYQSDLVAIRMDAKNQQLTDTADLFGSLAGIAQAGGDRLAKTAQVFGGIQATINAYVAASAAMAETPGSMLVRLAAYAKVLAVGLGAVRAIKGARGSGGSGGAPSGVSASTVEQTPERRVVIDVQGDDWIRNLIEPVMSSIYEATRDGERVVFAR